MPFPAGVPAGIPPVPSSPPASPVPLRLLADPSLSFRFAVAVAVAVVERCRFFARALEPEPEPDADEGGGTAAAIAATPTCEDSDTPFPPASLCFRTNPLRDGDVTRTGSANGSTLFLPLTAVGATPFCNSALPFDGVAAAGAGAGGGIPTAAAEAAITPVQAPGSDKPVKASIANAG
jgi:hypothetical protein